jgi:hypothetical protein
MSTAIDEVSDVIVARMRLAWTPLAELDEGVLVEPDPRDVAGDRLVDDGLRGRAERRALRPADERVPLGAQSKSGSPSTRWLTRRTARRPAVSPTFSSM